MRKKRNCRVSLSQNSLREFLTSWNETVSTHQQGYCQEALGSVRRALIRWVLKKQEGAAGIYASTWKLKNRGRVVPTSVYIYPLRVQLMMMHNGQYVAWRTRLLPVVYTTTLSRNLFSPVLMKSCVYTSCFLSFCIPRSFSTVWTAALSKTR